MAPNSPAPKSTQAASASKPSSKHPRVRRDPGAPKRALTAFTYFGNTVRPRIKATKPTSTFADTSQQIATEWKAVGKEVRVEMEGLATKDKERYEREMLAYERRKKQDAANALAYEDDFADDESVNSNFTGFSEVTGGEGALNEEEVLQVRRRRGEG